MIVQADEDWEHAYAFYVRRADMELQDDHPASSNVNSSQTLLRERARRATDNARGWQGGKSGRERRSGRGVDTGGALKCHIKLVRLNWENCSG